LPESHGQLPQERGSLSGSEAVLSTGPVTGTIGTTGTTGIIGGKGNSIADTGSMLKELGSGVSPKNPSGVRETRHEDWRSELNELSRSEETRPGSEDDIRPASEEDIRPWSEDSLHKSKKKFGKECVSFHHSMEMQSSLADVDMLTVVSISA
uniref:hypothetical protein n=1 Tax=Methanomethylophilus alvi TaxID=1291540 RepID=UPI0037DC2B85